MDKRRGLAVAEVPRAFEELNPASLDSGSHSRFTFHSYQLVAASFGLPPEPSFEPFFTLCISLRPGREIIPHLVLHHGVEDDRDFVRVAVIAAAGPSLLFMRRR